MVPPIAVLRAEAKQIIDLDGGSVVTAIAAAALAAANNGTPLSPNLTTQELYDAASEIIGQPESDIIAILVNQLMKYLQNPGVGGGGIFAGIGNPNGVVEATGPALYFDRTDPTAPIWYSKVTPGTSDSEWIG
jgi:hypothetical protein